MHAKTATFDFRREQIVFRYVSLAIFTEMPVTLTNTNDKGQLKIKWREVS